MSRWSIILLVVVIVLVLAALIYAFVTWRRRQTRVPEVEDSEPPTARRVVELSRAFYRSLPEHALHFPTIVVLGEIGSGKSTLIDARVAWKGESYQLAEMPERKKADDLLWLYLGPDVVVHEISLKLLRDNDPSTKRALRQLWQQIGPTATIALVVDATTLLDMDGAACRELAQLVRGKIGLVPERARSNVEVRLYLSKLDLVPGYLDFAALLGAAQPPIKLANVSGSVREAEALIEEFDAHLTYALVSVSGDEFDRLLAFYARLPNLVRALQPILNGLAGEGELFSTGYPIHELYLGSQVPNSHIGDLFAVDLEQIETSITRHERRHRRYAVALGAALSLGVASLTIWHGARVMATRRAVEEFERVQDADAGASSREHFAADRVDESIAAMESSEWLWMRWAFLPTKAHIHEDFEATIYTHYLKPKFHDNNRLNLIYLTSMIQATAGTPLGDLIIEHRQMWATALDFAPWVISTYIESSRVQREQIPPLPNGIDNPWAQWALYLRELSEQLDRDRLAPECFADIQRQMPHLYGPEEYSVLNRVRGLMLDDSKNLRTDVIKLHKTPLNPWADDEYEELVALRQSVKLADVRARGTESWGLASLVGELGRVRPVSVPPGFNVEIEKNGRVVVSVTSEEFDAVYLRSRRHEMIEAVLSRTDGRHDLRGREFFDVGAQVVDEGIVSGFGGGPRERINGIYTKAAFEAEVTDTLEFANAQLVAAPAPAEPDDSLDPEAAAEDEDENEDGTNTEEVPVHLDLTAKDRQTLDRVIRAAAANYARAYRSELINYYTSFEFDPGSEVALPFAIKPFAESNSWFTDFLCALGRNLALELPASDPGEYFEDQRRTLETFSELAALLAEDNGQLPGLEPYQALITALQQEVAGAVENAGDPEAPDLVGRLSTLGAFALGVETRINQDYADLTTDWLYGADIDPEWFGPFLAPIEQVIRYGMLDVQAKVTTAWKADVRPIALPLLDLYPFNASSHEDIDPDELEEVLRMQSEIPGAFWEAFDRLIRPALREDKIAMLRGLRSPGGLIPMARDLERLSNTLWDEKGERVELTVEIMFGLLPVEAYEDRIASRSSVASGGGSVYGFNQRALTQTMRYKWWEQGVSVVTLTLELPGVEVKDGVKQSVNYRLSADGEWSFYRLLDKARGLSLSTRKNTLTEIALYRGTRCDKRGPLRTRKTRIAWAVPLGRHSAQSMDVIAVVVSDPWQPFAVRRCF